VVKLGVFAQTPLFAPSNGPAFLPREVKILISHQWPGSLKFQGVNPTLSMPAQALTSTRTERAR
jgi:hypothetical protein